MKRFLTALLLIAIAFSLAACSSQPIEPTQEPSSASTQEPPQSAAPSSPSLQTEPTVPEPTLTPEPKRYVPADLFGSAFNPLADLELPDFFTVFAASFNKGSAKLEGRNPYTLFMTADGNMFAAVAYLADIAGLSEEEKNDRFNEYAEGGLCEFRGTDGRVVTIRQTRPHDAQHENGACLIEIAFDVPAADVEKYTDVIRDNYNRNALTSVAEYLDTETGFTECSIEVNLQNNETVVGVQHYVEDSEAVRQRIADNLQCTWGEWYGHPSAEIPYGLIKNTFVFDTRSGTAVLILQTSKELNSPLSEYVEPELSLTKFGFGFDEARICGVYEERDPHYSSVAIHRPEWGEHPDGWNIEFMDMVNGYGLRITYHEAEHRYRISVDKDGGASFDYFPETGEYAGYSEEAAQIFNDVFGTQGDDFTDQPLAYFEQFVRERFGLSIQELYALPKQ